MRKIIVFLLILTISSFSFVYAQENFNLNKENKEESLSNYSESKEKLEKSHEESENEETTTEKGPEGLNMKEDQDDSNIKVQEVKEGDEAPIKASDGNKGKSELKGKGVQAVKKTNISKSKEEKKVATSTRKKADTEKKNNSVEEKVEVVKDSDGSPKIDVGNANKGSFKAKYLSDKKLKVMVTKGGEKYTYDLKGDNSYQSYPLQLGDGDYKVSIMENIGGNEYKYVLSVNVKVRSSNPNAKYLTSVQMINWTKSMAPIKKAKSLTDGLSDQKKLEKIYNFVVNNIKYDSSITKLPSGYIPNINTTYSSKKGICYDFASIFAGMLRSVGIPTKLIKGTSSNVSGYHAWNEVYINGKWRIIDTSYDSQLKAGGHTTTLYKTGKDYSKSKVY